VIDSPHVQNAEEEASKFLLLPDRGDDYHDVPIFFASPVRAIQDEPTRTKDVGVPRSRELLVGRNVLKYSILSNLSPESSTDAVRVYGPEDLGKTALVAEVCNHILQRPRSPPQLDYIFWFPSTSKMHDDDSLYDSISSFVSVIIQNDSNKDDNLRQLRHSIAEVAHQKSLLLIFDTREYEKHYNGETSNLLHNAIDTLLEVSKARYSKVILISEKPSTQSTTSLREEPVPVSALDFESAVTLFAHRIPDDLRWRYPELNSRKKLEKLINYLDPPEEAEGFLEHDDQWWDRYDEMWERFFGSGVPSRCCNIARRVSDRDIERLINWWDPVVEDSPDDDDFPSIVE